MKIQPKPISSGAETAKAVSTAAKTPFPVKTPTTPASRDGFEKMPAPTQPRGLKAFKALLGKVAEALANVISQLKNSLSNLNVGKASQASGSVVNNTAATATAAQAAPQANLAATRGGTANAADVALVEAELSKVPEIYRQLLADNNARVIVVRNGVTEHWTHLRGVQPRGWPPGSTWDQVTGGASGKEAVIAVVGHNSGAPRLDHAGSRNVVLHEVGHILHNIAGGFSDDFVNARNADFGNLSDYERQSGTAGLQETFAESFARAFLDPNYQRTHPHLYAYWHSMPNLQP